MNLQNGLIKNVNFKPLMVYDEITSVSDYLNLSYPIENGIIVNLKDSSFLFYNIFN